MRILLLNLNQDRTKKISNFEDFGSARNNIVGNQAIISNNRLVFIKNGLASANPTTSSTTRIYDSQTLTGDNRTYVIKGTNYNILMRVKIGLKFQLGIDQVM